MNNSTSNSKYNFGEYCTDVLFGTLYLPGTDGVYSQYKQ
jgi:hypothetical protein